MTFRVEYKLHSAGEVKGIDVAAKSRADAYRVAVFDKIPQIEGEQAYSAWVASVTYQNGNYRRLNNFEGKPF